MLRKLTEWHKAAKIQMVMKDISYTDLAAHLGLSRTYLSALINARAYSDPAEKAISDYLCIPDGDFTIQIKYIPKRK